MSETTITSAKRQARAKVEQVVDAAQETVQNLKGRARHVADDVCGSGHRPGLHHGDLSALAADGLYQDAALTFTPGDLINFDVSACRRMGRDHLFSGGRPCASRRFLMA